MACYDTAQHPTPVCDGPAILIYMQRPGDSIPTPVWVTATCGYGEVTGFNYFSDAAGTDPITGFTITDRIPTPSNTLGLSCEGAMATDLCPSSLNPILAGLDDIETSVVANTNNLTTRIGAQTTALNNALTSQTTTLKASIDLPQTNYSYAFTYNAEGDILTLTRNGTIGGSAVCQVKTYTYNGLSQLTGISAWVAC